jgi:hypothetical protein
MWEHKKHGKKQFSSSYLYAELPHTGKMERSLVFVCWNKDGSLKEVITVGSWQKAKQLGWVKVK